MVHEEFPLTLKRQSPEPVILNLKPAALGSGVASKMVEGVLSSSDAMSPRTLGKLALPPDQAEGPILSAMGRNGAKLYDLLHSRELSAFRQGAKHGVLSVRCAGDLCSVQLWSAWGQRAMKLGWRDAWIFVQQLVKLADQPHRA